MANDWNTIKPEPKKPPADEFDQYKVPAGGDEFDQYLEKPKPGDSMRNPLQESGLKWGERAALKWFGPGDTKAIIKWLQERPGEGGKPKSFSLDPFGLIPIEDLRQYQAGEYAPGKIAMKPFASKEPWRVFDPDTGPISKDTGYDLMDLGDLAPYMVSPGTGAKAMAGKVVGGAAAGAGKSGMMSALGKLAYGFEEPAEETALKASFAGLGGAVAPPLAREIKAAGQGMAEEWLPAIGKALQAPYRSELAVRGAAARTLERSRTGGGQKHPISGAPKNPAKDFAVDEAFNAAQRAESQDAAFLAQQKAADAARMNESLDRMFGQAKESLEKARNQEAKEGGRLAQRARSTEETAYRAREGTNASDFRKHAARAIEEAKKLERAAAETEDEGRRAGLLEGARVYRANAKESARKAQEITNRLAHYRQGTAERTAEEAAEAYKGVKPATTTEAPARELPTIEEIPVRPRTTPATEPQPAGAAAKGAKELPGGAVVPEEVKVWKELDDLIKTADDEVSDAVFQINGDWFDKRMYLGELWHRKLISKAEFEAEHKAIASEVQRTIHELNNVAHSDIQALKIKQMLATRKVPTEGEIRSDAEKVLETARTAPELPSKSAMFERIKASRPQEPAAPGAEVQSAADAAAKKAIEDAGRRSFGEYASWSAGGAGIGYLAGGPGGAAIGGLVGPAVREGIRGAAIAGRKIQDLGEFLKAVQAARPDLPVRDPEFLRKIILGYEQMKAQEAATREGKQPQRLRR